MGTKTNQQNHYPNICGTKNCSTMGKRSSSSNGNHNTNSNTKQGTKRRHESDNDDGITTPNQSVVVVLPGDQVLLDHHHHKEEDVAPTSTDTQSKKVTPTIRYQLGPGLRYDTRTKQVVATSAGRLVRKDHVVSPGSNNNNNNNSTRMVTYHIAPPTPRHFQQRYRPAMNDRVVGIVVDRISTGGVDTTTTTTTSDTTAATGGEWYRVDIQAAQLARLCNLQFTGATKRNKPILLPGQIVYCRVLNDTTTHDQNNADEPILLSCQNGPYDVGVPSKDWTTKENVYGELRNGGTTCRISMSLARSLLGSSSSNDENIVLDELAKHAQKIPFEVAIGVNGLVWIHSTKEEYTILIQNAIQNSNVLNAEQIRAMVKNLIDIVQAQLRQRNE